MMATMVKEKIMTKSTNELLARFFEIIDEVEEEEQQSDHPLFASQPSTTSGFKPNRVICCDQKIQREMNELLDVLRTHV